MTLDRDTEALMYWLFLLALMLLIPALVGVQTWREARRPADDTPGRSPGTAPEIRSSNP